MNCGQAESLIAAGIAGELSAADRAALDEHLGGCEHCRQTQANWQADDRQLHAGFDPWRGAIETVAARTIRQLHRERLVVPVERARRTGLPFVLGLAAGFLVALGLWRPWNAVPVANVPAPVKPSPTPNVPPPNNRDPQPVLASVVGNVEILPTEHGAWATAQAGAEVPLGCAIRTQRDGLCEFTCPTGERARLNVDSQLRIRDADEFELVRGQVWAGAQPERELRVRTASGLVLTTGGAVNVQQAAEETVITAAVGDATVRMVNHEESLVAGEELTISRENVIHRDRAYSLALITAWMSPLMALKSPDDPELNAHVDALLSQLGETKMSLLSDSELRALGASCTVPLSRYVRSERSQNQVGSRRHAARLLADLAPLSLAGDIVELLADADGEVRAPAAACLKRLTGQDMDVPVENWSNPPDALQQSALERWHAWWQENSFRCQPAPRSTLRAEKTTA